MPTKYEEMKKRLERQTRTVSIEQCIPDEWQVHTTDILSKLETVYIVGTEEEAKAHILRVVTANGVEYDCRRISREVDLEPLPEIVVIDDSPLYSE